MNRSHLYGDLLFETIKITDGEPMHAHRHFARLMRGADLLCLEKENLTFDIFINEIEKAVAFFYHTHATATNNTLRVRFVLYRGAGGFYLPQNNSSSFYAEAHPFWYEATDKPLTAGIYRQQAKAPGPLSNMKTGNALVYILAALYAKEQGLDDALLLNSAGNIIEATASNVFWFSHKKWYTPPLADGCVAGIMREVFMETHEVIESSCTAAQLLQADKAILTNALYGYRNFVCVAP